MGVIESNVFGGNVREMSAKVQASRINTVYESHEDPAFTLTTPTSIKTIFPGPPAAFNSFTNNGKSVGNVYQILIRTDTDIEIRLNSSTNDKITLAASEGKLVITEVEINDIFLNLVSAGSANIKVFMA